MLLLSLDGILFHHKLPPTFCKLSQTVPICTSGYGKMHRKSTELPNDDNVECSQIRTAQFGVQRANL